MIDVEIEDPAWARALPDSEPLATAAAEAVFALLPCEAGEEARAGERETEGAADAPQNRAPSTIGSSADGPPPPSSSGQGRMAQGEQWGLTILLADDGTVRDLNARFRGKDKATNVLSFPAPANPEAHLGDLALAFGVCAREAAEQGKPLAHHLQHLVAHGVLHLLGYDHMSDDEAETMEGLERVVLAGLGVPDPYEAGERDHD